MVMKSERKLTSSQKWEVEGTFRTGASEASAVSDAWELDWDSEFSVDPVLKTQ